MACSVSGQSWKLAQSYLVAKEKFLALTVLGKVYSNLSPLETIARPKHLKLYHVWLIEKAHVFNA